MREVANPSSHLQYLRPSVSSISVSTMVSIAFIISIILAPVSAAVFTDITFSSNFAFTLQINYATVRFPLFFYPMLIDSLANGKEALKRIATYLAREELTPYVQHLPKSDDGGSVELRNGNFLWSAANQPDIARGEQRMGAPALCDASLNVGPGEVVAVVGSVATGKSALCKSLIGELAPVPRVVVDQSEGDKTEMSFRTRIAPRCCCFW